MEIFFFFKKKFLSLLISSAQLKLLEKNPLEQKGKTIIVREERIKKR